MDTRIRGGRRLSTPTNARAPSRALSLGLGVLVLCLSACLLHTNAQIVVPIYGAVPVASALTRAESMGLIAAALVVQFGGGPTEFFAHSRQLALFTVGALSIMPYLLRYIHLAERTSGFDIAWLIPITQAPYLAMLTATAMRICMDACSVQLRRRLYSGTALDDFEKWLILCIVAIVPGAYQLITLALPTVLRQLSACSPDLYVELANSVLSRWKLHSGLSIALQISVAARMKIGSRRMTVIVLLVWLPCFYQTYLQENIVRTNSILATAGYELLDRKESLTGYVSVVENNNQHFRVLRNDHSLLGGHWLPTPESQAHGSSVEESIYGVFHMLEAVRLMVPDGAVRDFDVDIGSTQALVIGLGVGTAPSALAAHGITTTAVDIDPVVINFARQYFNLDSGVQTVNKNALDFVAAAALTGKHYDHIIHDVFAGGSEPEALFSAQFLLSLKTIMSEHGTVSINYAGDLNSTATINTLLRINAIFAPCAFYRDNEPLDASSAVDLANVVVYCAHTPWHFREPVEADFLKSETRRQFLLPRYRLDIDQLSADRERQKEKPEQVDDETLASAVEHWKIMRRVMPDIVWETW